MEPKDWITGFTGRAIGPYAIKQLLELTGPDPPHRLRITREQVFAAGKEDQLRLFLAVLAWGWGSRGGRGWHVASNALRTDGEEGVRAAVTALRDLGPNADPESLFAGWSAGGVAKLTGLNTAFASKLAYFAVYDRARGTGPLIADRNTAWYAWALFSVWDSRRSSAAYGDYVSHAQEWARRLDCRSDDIERALFALGPCVEHIYLAHRHP